MATAKILDKTFDSSPNSFGTISIRVVVLKPKPREADERLKEATPEEEDDPQSGSPLGAYLERRAGKKCVVFLINGQRHDALDGSFIGRDLGFKHLRTRTMITVDLDGLSLDAIAEIVQGSRQGLYEGQVMAAVHERLVATLREDPDLTRLQTEAEQEIAELQAGDEVVRKQLDQLIDSHHVAADHFSEGAVEPATEGTADFHALGKPKSQDVVIGAPASVGDAADLPILTATPRSMRMQLRPDEERSLLVASVPEPAWAELENMELRISPKVDELSVHTEHSATGARVTLVFSEPSDFEVGDYPVFATLRAFAKFKGKPELRVLEREIVINPKKSVEPPIPKPKPPLKTTPTFLKVVSRQPVRLVPGGASTHVRLKWDGLDELVAGSPPAWTFRARCSSLSTFPPMSFSAPNDGRFEVLLDTPHGLLPGLRVDFEVEALGPGGAQLAATFTGEVAAKAPSNEPRKIERRAPEPVAQRRPPYVLKYVREADWSSPTCWGETEWTESDAAAFSEPTTSTPLTLMINEDAAGLRTFREGLVARKLDENTVRDRVTRYTAHVAFHLYQMYTHKVARETALETGDADIHVPGDDELRAEIARVASTLLRVMEVSR